MKHYLLCYDISNKKRLASVHKKLIAIGIPLQFSIFYLNTDAKSLEEKLAELTKIIDKKEDDIRVYTLHSFNITAWKKADVNKINQALLVV